MATAKHSVKITRVRVELVEQRIYLIRGEKVMIDAYLADLYQVTTFNLNKAVKRNVARFPTDFMFRLTQQETQSLTFQIGMSKKGGRGGRRTTPYVFTEQGVAMLSSVLKSERAIQVNIAIMRAFVKLRDMLATHKNVLQKLGDIERTQREQGKHISTIWRAIENLMAPAALPPKRRIGF